MAILEVKPSYLRFLFEEIRKMEWDFFRLLYKNHDFNLKEKGIAKIIILSLGCMLNTFCKFSVVFVLLLCFSFTGKGQSSNAVGNAYLTSDNCFVLTEASEFQLGAVWFNEQLDLSEAFEMELLVNFGSSDFNGADGMVFIMQQVGLNALGDAGGGMGFGGFQPSFGVEMDTYQNQDLGDPFQDHVALLVDGNVNHFTPGNLLGPVSIDPNGLNVEDGQDHVFKLVWDPILDVVQVFFDCELRLELNLDLVDDVFNGNPLVFWGFSGATGGLTNVQSVCISNYALGLPEDVVVCAGESVEIGVVGSENGSYQWEPTTFLDSPNESVTNCTPDSDIDYTVTYTDLCGTQTVEEVSVSVIQFFPELQDEVSFCEGDEATVSAIGDPAWNYVWSNDALGQEVLLNEAGVYSVEVSSEACSSTLEIEAITFELPTIDWTETLEACDGEVNVFETSGAGLSYEWHDSSTAASYQTATEENVSVTITDLNGCQKFYEGSSIIHPNPQANLPEIVELCEGEEVVLSPQEGTVTAWSTGSTDQTLTVSEDAVISVEVISANNCLGTDETAVVVNPLPQWNPASDWLLCEGQEVALAYPSNFVLNTTLSSDADSIYLSESGSFNATLSNSITACNDTFTFFVDVLGLPKVTLPNRLNLCEGNVIEIQPDIENVAFAFWEDGLEGTFRTILEEGYYVLNVENECGTASDDVEVIEIICDCPIYIPNAITPNNDGVNDVFIHQLDCDHINYEFRIYNRWGQVVFSADQPGIAWDGSLNSGEYYSQNEVYTWHLEVELILPVGARIVQRTGSVTVLR